MLVLTRKQGEQIQIGDTIRVTLVKARDGRVRIGIEAPPEVVILREEIQSEFWEAETEEDGGMIVLPR